MPVLVTCMGGVGRSSTLVLAHLLAGRFREEGPDVALQFLNARRAMVSPSAEQIEAARLAAVAPRRLTPAAAHRSAPCVRRAGGNAPGSGDVGSEREKRDCGPDPTKGHGMVRVDGNGNGEGLIQVRGLGKSVPTGRGGDPRPPGPQPRRGERRVRRLHGAERIGQDDASEPRGRFGRSVRRDRHRGRRRDHPHVPPEAHRLAGPARGLRLPGLQPDPGPDRVPERGPAAPPDPSRARRSDGSTWRRRCASWASRSACTTSPASSPAGRSSGWPSPGPSWPTRRSFSATSPPATWTARAPRRSSTS